MSDAKDKKGPSDKPKSPSDTSRSGGSSIPDPRFAPRGGASRADRSELPDATRSSRGPSFIPDKPPAKTGTTKEKGDRTSAKKPETEPQGDRHHRPEIKELTPPENVTGENSSKKQLQQNSSDLKHLYQEAGPARDDLKQFADQLASKTGGESIIPDLKSEERALQKITTDYKGKANRIVDIARGTIRYDTMDQVNATRGRIEKDLQETLPGSEIVRLKDRFTNPLPSGYSDLLYNIRMPNGHITELQIHLKPIETVKPLMHEIYEQVQTIEKQAAQEGRELTSQERSATEALNQQSRNIVNESIKNWLK